MRETGSIGLGDGAAFAVLTREAAPFRLAAHALHNEMFHFTSNQPDGAGFAACAAAIAAAAGGRRVWVKGHGTGTLEAGRLEAEALARQFPGAPLAGWKGSLGHTLGSCGLVELAIALAALRGRRRQFPARSAARRRVSPTPSRWSPLPARASTAPFSPATPSAAPTPRCCSPMIERFLHHVRVELPAPDETAAGARVRLADKFPRTALRRMTHLGLLVGSALDGAPLGPDDALVYASTFAETRALEDFLASFPAASPLLFQTSIHPGGVQQVLIGRQQPIARLWPLAGRTRLVEQALLTALLEPAPRVALVGGEERGTWMLEHGMASAAVVCLRRDPDARTGRRGGSRRLHAGRGARRRRARRWRISPRRWPIAGRCAGRVPAERGRSNGV